MSSERVNGGPAQQTGSDDTFARITTGSVQADALLGGGFPSNSINIVMGQPGTGKTIFAEQLLFSNADGASDGRPILYVTTLSEPLSKVISYLQRFDFYVADKLGSAIQYEDMGSTLVEGGPAALLPWLRDTIRTTSPRIIVIDSFRAIHDLSISVPEMRRLVSELAGLLSAYDTTTFLLGEYTREDIQRYPEFAVADSVVEFARQPLSTRDERYFRVLKLRGSSYSEGQHAFRITNAGIHFFPRLVGPVIPDDYEPASDRVPSGIQGLDAMLGGGLWSGTTTLLLGQTGSGKTTLALQFALEGVRRNEGVLYVNFQENPSQLRRNLTNLGFDASQSAARGLNLIYSSPVELQIDSIIVEIFRHISTRRIQRLVVDAIGDLATAASDAQRLHDYLYSLVQHFVVNGVTSLLTFETGYGPTAVGNTEQHFSYISDNVLQIRLEGDDEVRRTIRVVKSRNSAHDTRARALAIDGSGARVFYDAVAAQ
jgi:circadian clock protein KaiC